MCGDVMEVWGSVHCPKSVAQILHPFVLGAILGPAAAPTFRHAHHAVVLACHDGGHKVAQLLQVKPDLGDEAHIHHAWGRGEGTQVGVWGDAAARSYRLARCFRVLHANWLA